MYDTDACLVVGRLVTIRIESGHTAVGRPSAPRSASCLQRPANSAYPIVPRPCCEACKPWLPSLPIGIPLPAKMSVVSVVRRDDCTAWGVMSLWYANCHYFGPDETRRESQTGAEGVASSDGSSGESVAGRRLSIVEHRPMLVTIHSVFSSKPRCAIEASLAARIFRYPTA